MVLLVLTGYYSSLSIPTPRQRSLTETSIEKQPSISASFQAKPATPQVPLLKPTQGKQTNDKFLPHSHFLIHAVLFR